jgi:deazaflavin-dependent oxidoreductase (nitroreductase family)
VRITKKKPTGTLRAFLRLPIYLFHFHLGWLFGNRFLLLTHTGRKSGILRQAVIEVVKHDKESGTYYVAAAWRNKADWYLNILNTPKVKVQVGERQFEAEANQISRKEAVNVLWDYAQEHPAALRELTLLMLGERLLPNRVTCVRLADDIPLIALVPLYGSSIVA